MKQTHTHTYYMPIFVTHSPVFPLVLICTVPLESLRCWIESSQSWGPRTTKFCSSVRWPHSWQSWKTTLPIATSSTYVWMVRQLPSSSVWPFVLICNYPIFSLWLCFTFDTLLLTLSILSLFSCIPTSSLPSLFLHLRHYKGGGQRNVAEDIQRPRVRVLYFPAEHKSRRSRPQPAVCRHCGHFWLRLEPPSGENTPL